MKKFLLVLAVILGIGGIGLLLAANQGYFGYSLGNTNGLKARLNQTLGSAAVINVSVSTIEEHGVCKEVSSTDARDIFIPTKSELERLTFIEKKPGYINFNVCGCRTNSDCGEDVCIGYFPSISYSRCSGTYPLDDGNCVGNCAGATNPNCSCSGIEKSECGADWTSHGCHRQDNVNMYNCSDFNSNQTGCLSRPTCDWHPAQSEILGLCAKTTCETGIPAACFIAGTKVKTSNGITINIEDITRNIKLLGLNGEIQTVQKPLKIRYTGKLYSINNSDYFVTASHPFMTIQGWKSFDPNITKIEIPDLIVTKLDIGDILVTEKGLEKIYQASFKETKQYVYNLELDGNHTYYADGYLVHNKLFLNKPCTYNVQCESNSCYYGLCNGTVYKPSVNSCCSCTFKAQCPLTYDCISGKCSKSGIVCDVPSVCGNGILEPGEKCDRSAVNGDTCIYTPDLQQKCENCRCVLKCKGYYEGNIWVPCSMN